MVIATFCKSSSVHTKGKKDKGDGALMAFGLYTIQFANWVFDNEKPEKIIATSSLKDTG